MARVILKGIEIPSQVQLCFFSKAGEIFEPPLCPGVFEGVQLASTYKPKGALETSPSQWTTALQSSISHLD
jgi:hypothetical protein